VKVRITAWRVLMVSVALFIALALVRAGKDLVGHATGQPHYRLLNSLVQVDWTDVILEIGEENNENFVHHGPPPERKDNDKLWNTTQRSKYKLRASCTDGREQRKKFRVSFDGTVWNDVYCLLPPRTA
jgi:hypothetical protein